VNGSTSDMEGRGSRPTIKQNGGPGPTERTIRKGIEQDGEVESDVD